MVWVTREQWPWLLLFLILALTIIFIMFEAFAKLPLVEVMIFVNTGPVVAMFLSIFILKEKVVWREIAGGLFAFAAVCLIVFGNYLALKEKEENELD